MSIKNMIENEKLDAVHLCLPHNLHSKVAIYAFEHGINVLTEKPMDVDLKSAELAVETAKRAWLARHLPSVEWDEIKIVRYGTNKYITCGGGILFDDEQWNRDSWKDPAYEPCKIMEVLKELLNS